MREVQIVEIKSVSGGYISGYQGAGAVLAVFGTGAAIATAPISAPVIGLALGVAGGLAAAQFLADMSFKAN